MKTLTYLTSIAIILMAIAMVIYSTTEHKKYNNLQDRCMQLEQQLYTHIADTTKFHGTPDPTKPDIFYITGEPKNAIHDTLYIINANTGRDTLCLPPIIIKAR